MLPLSDLTTERCQRVGERCSIPYVEFHEQLGSTSDRARELAADLNLTTPALVAAKLQTAGRGQRSNTWWATEGALTFSLILDDAICECSQAWLSLGTAIAVAAAIERLVPDADVALKWPNDVYLSGDKVGGILVETIATPVPRTVIGVGVNVNNSLADAPPALQARATSIFDVAHSRTSTAALLRVALSEIAQQLTVGRPQAELRSAWSRRCILTGKRVTVERAQDSLTGMCDGVDETGALVVTSAGDQFRLVSGRISSF